MKKFKILSFVLTLVLVFNALVPATYAIESNSESTLQLSTPVTSGEYTLSGVETTEVRYNILINNKEQTGQFAIVYLDSPDYMYEFVFDLDDITHNSTNYNFADIQAYCFENKNHWREVYLPTAVTIVTEDENQPQTYSSYCNERYFNNWLTNKYGNGYSGKLLTTKTQNGTKMYLKSAFRTHAYKDKSYLLSTNMTVVGFVTSVLGFSSNSKVVSVIGVIAGLEACLKSRRVFTNIHCEQIGLSMQQ